MWRLGRQVQSPATCFAGCGDMSVGMAASLCGGCLGGRMRLPLLIKINRAGHASHGSATRPALFLISSEKKSLPYRFTGKWRKAPYFSYGDISYILPLVKKILHGVAGVTNTHGRAGHARTHTLRETVLRSLN